MAKIKTIEDESDEIIYPVTSSKAVYHNGQLASEILDEVDKKIDKPASSVTINNVLTKTTSGYAWLPPQGGEGGDPIETVLKEVCSIMKGTYAPNAVWDEDYGLVFYTAHDKKLHRLLPDFSGIITQSTAVITDSGTKKSIFIHGGKLWIQNWSTYTCFNITDSDFVVNESLKNKCRASYCFTHSNGFIYDISKTVKKIDPDTYEEVDSFTQTTSDGKLIRGNSGPFGNIGDKFYGIGSAINTCGYIDIITKECVEFPNPLGNWGGELRDVNGVIYANTDGILYKVTMNEDGTFKSGVKMQTTGSNGTFTDGYREGCKYNLSTDMTKIVFKNNDNYQSPTPYSYRGKFGPLMFTIEEGKITCVRYE